MWNKCAGRRLTRHFYLPSQELTGAHLFPPEGPNQQRPGVLTKGLTTPGAGSGRGVILETVDM